MLLAANISPLIDTYEYVVILTAAVAAVCMIVLVTYKQGGTE